MGLYQLTYQSQSLVPFQAPELVSLLRQSQHYNRARHISGLLLYTPDGRFLQVLEGEKEAVRHLYCNRIVADPRHHNCQVFGEGALLYRTFADWNMGFRTAHADNMRTLLGQVASSNLALRIPRAHTSAELMELLLAFVAHHETVTELETSW